MSNKKSTKVKPSEVPDFEKILDEYQGDDGLKLDNDEVHGIEVMAELAIEIFKAFEGELNAAKESGEDYPGYRRLKTAYFRLKGIAAMMGYDTRPGSKDRKPGLGAKIFSFENKNIEEREVKKDRPNNAVFDPNIQVGKVAKGKDFENPTPNNSIFSPKPVKKIREEDEALPVMPENTAVLADSAEVDPKEEIKNEVKSKVFKK